MVWYGLPQVVSIAQPQTGTLAQDQFPRIRLQVIAPSGSAYAGSAFQTACGLFNIVDFGPYMGIEQNQGQTFATIFANIKAAGTANGIITRCLHYTNSANQGGTGPTGQNLGSNGVTYTVWTSRLNSANWWLLTSFPSGTVVEDSFSDGGTMQSSSQNTVTFNGLRFGPGYWDHYDKVLRQGLSTTLGYASNVSIATNSLVDGYQMDNVFCTPREAGAWQNTTSSFAAGNAQAAAWLQQGQALQVAALKAINPNLLVMCNADYFIHSTANISSQVALDPSQLGIMDMVYCQAVIGVGGIAQFGTFNQVMANLIAAEAQMAATGTLIFEQSGVTSGAAFSNVNQASWTSADWQSARYGLGWCHMRNWHYNLSFSEQYAPSQILRMDEFGPQHGVRPWLGNPIDPPQTAARVQGVWFRQFQGGLAFMNPAGNGTQTINLTTLGFSNLKAVANIGFGDATINTGNPVTSITLQAADGRFLTF